MQSNNSGSASGRGRAASGHQRNPVDLTRAPAFRDPFSLSQDSNDDDEEFLGGKGCVIIGKFKHNGSVSANIITARFDDDRVRNINAFHVEIRGLDNYLDAIALPPAVAMNESIIRSPNRSPLDREVRLDYVEFDPAYRTNDINPDDTQLLRNWLMDRVSEEIEQRN
ncbi:hypothetical protein N431DRAFT_565167 [Stipitochalara longipes BDJ]|nr:hypothetical protein N431DRAFT_565167 [Stipitochalara longipes BDJ]